MKSLTDLTRDFHNSRKLFEQLTAQTPRIMGIMGVKVVNENFDLQGFASNEGAVDAWKARSPITDKIYDQRKGGVKGSVYNSANPILEQTGKLRALVKYVAAQKRVNIGVNLNLVPYAKLMNEGGTTTWDGKTVRVPARRFLGMSQKLKKRIEIELKRKREQAFSKFKVLK